MLEIKLIRSIASNEPDIISCLFSNILFDTCKKRTRNLLFRKYNKIMDFMNSPEN